MDQPIILNIQRKPSHSKTQNLSTEEMDQYLVWDVDSQEDQEDHITTSLFEAVDREKSRERKKDSKHKDSKKKKKTSKKGKKRGRSSSSDSSSKPSTDSSDDASSSSSEAWIWSYHWLININHTPHTHAHQQVQSHNL